RFYATINREPVDRLCTWLGIHDGAAHRKLFAYFEVGSLYELIEKLDDDMVPIEMPYDSPTSDAIYAAFDFAKRGCVPREHRTLNSPGFFEDIDDPARVDEFDWPDPENHIDPDACRAVAEGAPRDRAVLAVIWSAHFQDACAAFGMENAFIKMVEQPEMVHAVTERIVEFYLKANEIFFEATKGKIDAVLIGNDFGAQKGLLLSPDMIRAFALPGTRRIIEQAKSYGIKVIHHSCGSIRPIIPDLIEAGADAIHPVQALAKDMEPSDLHSEFGDRVSFCGGVDAQYLMVRGTPDGVKAKVHELKSIFSTGLIVSPSHEAILPDTHPANILAMFEAVRED
ncbi:methyltransferase, partial [bacterium]|nr:methyltransferase [bacterium]